MTRRACAKVVGLAGLVICLAVGGCKKKAGGAGEPNVKAATEETDKKCRDMLAETGKVSEARQWLAPTQTNHWGFEVSRDQMLTWAEEFYTDGAQKVWVADIEKMGDKEIAAIMIVEMPTDFLKRQAVLKREAEFKPEEDQGGAKPTPDVGQKYVFLALD